MQRTARRPQRHPRHDDVRERLLDVPAAKGGRTDRTYRLGDHFTLYEDGRAVWEKPERSYAVNDWWTDEQGEVWAIDDGALDGLLDGLSDSRRGIDGFIVDLDAIRQGLDDEDDDEADEDDDLFDDLDDDDEDG